MENGEKGRWTKQSIMKLIQVNVDRSKRAMDLLRQNCDSKQIDLAIVAEPNKNMTKHNSKWITDNRIDAAIYIPQSKLKIRKSGSENGYVWVETDTLVIYSCYITPVSQEEEFQRFLFKLNENIRQHGKNVLICGDFNAKAYCWGSPREDKKGSILAEWISQKNLTILNDGKTPTFERNGGSSYIDITVCSTNLGKLVRSWEVSEEENLSYHKNIYIELSTKQDVSKSALSKGWIYQRERKEQLLEKLEQEVMHLNSAHQATGIGNAIKNACNSTLKKKYSHPQRRGAYWWNDEIADLRNKCTKVKRKTTRANKRANISEEEKQQIRDEYRQCRKALKKSILKSKISAWNALCAEVDVDLWGTGYKIVTCKFGLRSPLKITDEEQLRIANKLFPRHEIKTWPNIETEPNDIPPCTDNEIIEAGQKIKPGKAAGPDGIPPEVVKDIALQKPIILKKTLNTLIRKGVFPKDWKIGKLTLIEKPNKTGEEKTFRPIILLNAIGKLFEHVINRRLVEEVESKEGLSPKQFGFRKGLSTIDAIQTVQNIAEETNSNSNKYAALVTLDVKNAFNSVPWKNIIEELKRRQIANYLIRLICSYLENREIRVGEQQELEMTCGVPQGSVLGPTLWNLYYDGVLKQDMPEGTTIIGYADDLALIVCGQDRKEIEEGIKWAVGRIESWMIKKGLQLAPQKTEVVILAGKRTIRNISVEIDNVEITSQRQLKYLGITLGHNMDMGSHIKSVTEKAERAVAALGRLMPNVGGPKSSKRKLLSHVANSIILYGAPAWKSWIEKLKYRKMIDKVQRKMAIRITSAYRTVATKSVQVIAGTIPIHLLVKERTYEKEANQKAQRKRARENTMRIWQQEWDEETQTAQWTKKLIPQIIPWFERKHGEVGFFLTQFLSGHGRFKSYLARFGLVESEECTYCGEIDTAEHTILKCTRWHDTRERVEIEIGEQLTVENVIRHMLSSDDKWNMVNGLIGDILREKERDERIG